MPSKGVYLLGYGRSTQYKHTVYTMSIKEVEYSIFTNTPVKPYFNGFTGAAW